GAVGGGAAGGGGGGAAPPERPGGATVSLLEVRGLKSGYREGTVLDGVDLDLAPGRTLALLGRNGVGKTTLALTLMGLVRPTAGSVRLDGRELAGRRSHEIARAGVALGPQGGGLWPALTRAEHPSLAAAA